MLMRSEPVARLDYTLGGGTILNRLATLASLTIRPSDRILKKLTDLR